MKLNEYQTESKKTAIFDYLSFDPIVYLSLGLCGESGEVAEKVKKIIRNEMGQYTLENKEKIKDELGDVLWYLSQIADKMGFSLEEVARANLDKIFSRQARGVLRSEGDNR